MTKDQRRGWMEKTYEGWLKSYEMDDLLDQFEALEQEVGQLKAARHAYASEFPPDADGDPDVGSIHENIRKLKARVVQLENAIARHDSSGNGAYRKPLRDLELYAVLDKS